MSYHGETVEKNLDLCVCVCERERERERFIGNTFLIIFTGCQLLLESLLTVSWELLKHFLNASQKFQKHFTKAYPEFFYLFNLKFQNF